MDYFISCSKSHSLYVIEQDLSTDTLTLYLDTRLYPVIQLHIQKYKIIQLSDLGQVCLTPHQNVKVW